MFSNGQDHWETEQMAAILSTIVKPNTIRKQNRPQPFTFQICSVFQPHFNFCPNLRMFLTILTMPLKRRVATNPIRAQNFVQTQNLGTRMCRPNPGHCRTACRKSQQLDVVKLSTVERLQMHFCRPSKSCNPYEPVSLPAAVLPQRVRDRV